MVNSKFMCKVVTKNFPVTVVTPMIQRYTQVKKLFSVTEIASCLRSNATVYLVQDNCETLLTRTNFKEVLLASKQKSTVKEFDKAIKEESKKNEKKFEQLKETVKTEEVKTEAVQAKSVAAEPVKEVVVETAEKKEETVAETTTTDTKTEFTTKKKK